MNSKREAFEKTIVAPRGAVYNPSLDGYFWDNFPKVEHPFNENYESFKDGWQAATEQGVGEADYSVEADLEETQKALSAAEAKIEEYEGFFTGEDGDNHDGDSREIIRDYLRAHPPKPTGGGVPDLDALLSEFPGYHIEIELFPSGGMIEATGCEECGVDDSRFETVIWKRKGPGRASSFAEAVEKLKEKLHERYGSILATQQPPEQDAPE